MTQKQFDDLRKLHSLDTMYHSEEQMFITPSNVMEVRVSDRKKLSFKETLQLTDTEFDKWEKDND